MSGNRVSERGAVAKERLRLWCSGPAAQVRDHHQANEKEKKTIENEAHEGRRQNALPAGRPHLRQSVDGEDKTAKVEEKADHRDDSGAGR